jgi:hypothetical protein
VKVFITTYALTSGIIEVEAEQSLVCPTMVNWNIPGEYYGHAHGEGRNWHRTKDAAIAKAESMRLAKITSLKRSIKKLEALKFV